MTPEQEQRLREIEERLRGVTQGHWMQHVYRDHYVIDVQDLVWQNASTRVAVVPRDPVVLDETWQMQVANGALMAHAYEDVLFLLALLREREEENRRLREALESIRDICEYHGEDLHTRSAKAEMAHATASAALRGEQP